MKTKDLIKFLLEEDPTGETECCVGNCDIYYVSREPAYYDGKLETLQRNPNTKYYNIISGKYHTRGDKIQFHTMSIDQAIGTAVEFGIECPIDYSELGEDTAKAYKKANEQTRKAHVDMEHRLELEMFQRWVLEKADKINNLSEYKGYLKEASEIFFEKEKMDRHDPIPKYVPSGLSYKDMRGYQWDREVEIQFDGMDWTISKKEVEK